MSGKIVEDKPAYNLGYSDGLEGKTPTVYWEFGFLRWNSFLPIGWSMSQATTFALSYVRGYRDGSLTRKNEWLGSPP